MHLHGVYVLPEDPVVFALTDNFIVSLLPLLPPAVVPDLMVFGTWTFEQISKGLQVRWRLRRADRQRITWMCGTPREAQRMGLVGYRAMWCHHNLYCDESVLRPLPVAKKYDAVYTAVIRDYKRLPLAKEVGSLRILTGSIGQTHQLPAYGLAHAVVNTAYLNRAEMAEALNECRVGLALSAEEGGMLACTEYLLCGLPVVSTPSRGGRDVWLDPANSVIVPADAGAVAAAVRRLAADPPDPAAVRADAVRRSRFFRTTLAESVRRVSGRFPFDPEAIDGSWFNGRFVAIPFLKEYLASYANGRFGRSDLLGRHA